MNYFKGTAENIENNLNKVSSINSSSNDTQYPSAKAVFDFAKTDKIYDPESKQPQSGEAVAQAISHFDTILKKGNTFIFDGGKPSGKFDIDLVVDSTLDPQSENPIANSLFSKVAGELSKGNTANSEDITTIKEFLQKLSNGDYIVETGKIGNWTYEKRNSGICECWCILAGLKAGLVDDDAYNARYDLPFPIYDKHLQCTSYATWGIREIRVLPPLLENGEQDPTAFIVSLYVDSEDAVTTNASISINIKGFWKEV